MGVATQDPKLRAHFLAAQVSYQLLPLPQRYVNIWQRWVTPIQLNDIIGHTELIVRREGTGSVLPRVPDAIQPEVAKIKEKAELARILWSLAVASLFGSIDLPRADHDLDNVLDQQLIRGAQRAIKIRKKFDFAIKNIPIVLPCDVEHRNMVRVFQTRP